MKKVPLLLLLPLVTLSCSSLKNSPHYLDSTYVRSLESNLKKSEKDLQQFQKKIADIKKEIALAQLKAIQKQLESCKTPVIDEPSVEKGSVCSSHEDEFFLKERTILSSIIEEHPPLAMTAQTVLDQILTLITHIKNPE